VPATAFAGTEGQTAIGGSDGQVRQAGFDRLAVCRDFMRFRKLLRINYLHAFF